MTVLQSMELGDVLMGRLKEPKIGVYMVKAMDEVIYVGSSETINRRIRYHHKRDNSSLWQAITEFLPMSLLWKVNIIPFEPEQSVRYKMRQKEAELIRELKPHLNTYMQPEPSLR